MVYIFGIFFMANFEAEGKSKEIYILVKMSENGNCKSGGKIKVSL